MNRFALVGYPLGHSFSRSYFTEKFKRLGLDASYVNIECETLSELRNTISNEKIKGFNVTTPHKQTILSLLDDTSPEAEAIGAVNCVAIERDKWIGHNTDVHGFVQAIEQWQGFNASSALVLGNGGASKAVQYALKHRLGLDHQVVSRTGVMTYDQLTKDIIQGADLIVQCTTLGMHPNVDDAPYLNYQFIGRKHWCMDLVYNPSETLFMKRCANQGAQVCNGMPMLVAQAEMGWEIWRKSLER